MNQEKIGLFIAECRKAKKLTQAQLGEKLGVTEKSISNWENGRNMPDLSLFKPLCDELNITINDLMSGEVITTEKYQRAFEENIVNTIDYSTKKMSRYNQVISLILIVFGLFIAISAIMIFPSESSWGSIYSLFGILVFTAGIWQLANMFKLAKRLAISVGIFVMSLIVLLFTDYVNVVMHKEAPMFRLSTTTTGSVIYYDTLFYDVYRCHADEEDEYWVTTKNEDVTVEELLDYCK